MSQVVAGMVSWWDHLGKANWLDKLIFGPGRAALLEPPSWERRLGATAIAYLVRRIAARCLDTEALFSQSSYNSSLDWSARVVKTFKVITIGALCWSGARALDGYLAHSSRTPLWRFAVLSVYSSCVAHLIETLLVEAGPSWINEARRKEEEVKQDRNKRIEELNKQIKEPRKRIQDLCLPIRKNSITEDSPITQLKKSLLELNTLEGQIEQDKNLSAMVKHVVSHFSNEVCGGWRNLYLAATTEALMERVTSSFVHSGCAARLFYAAKSRARSLLV